MLNLSIVIPAYNEEKNIKKTVEDVFSTLKEFAIPYEIILVNDGSSDRTVEVAYQMARKIPHMLVIEQYPNRGYGGALKTGFAAAAKDLVVIFPADGQFRFAEVRNLLNLIDHADIVCGYRQRRQDPVNRKLNAFGWNSLLRLFFGYLSRDVDCGFKCFRRSVLSSIQLTSDGAMIDAELLATARALGLRIAETPVTHLPRQAGNATGANLRVIMKAFVDLLRFRIRLSRSLWLHEEFNHIHNS